jgi:hypothetical protein
MLEKLDDLVEVGLKINISKMKDLRVNNNTVEAFRLGKEAIETVDNFTYLGSKHTADGELLAECEKSLFGKLGAQNGNRNR